MAAEFARSRKKLVRSDNVEETSDLVDKPPTTIKVDADKSPPMKHA